MHRLIRLSALLLAAVAIVTWSGLDAALARGGAANIMDSPGYQRRLKESREQLQPPSPPPPAASVRRPPRHERHRRHSR